MGYNLLINGVYWGYNPLILTIDPNFQRDIQVGMEVFWIREKYIQSFWPIWEDRKMRINTFILIRFFQIGQETTK